MPPNLEIHHQEIANVIQDIFPMHRLVAHIIYLYVRAYRQVTLIFILV